MQHSSAIQKISRSPSGRRSALLCGAAAFVITMAGAAGETSAAGMPTSGTINLSTPNAAGTFPFGAPGAQTSNATLHATATTTNAAGSFPTYAVNPTGTASTISLNATRTLIDWTTYDVGLNKTLTYNFGALGTSADDVVINRLQTGAITVEGTINGMWNGVTGGNIWFIAPNGVMITTGKVSAGGIVVSTALTGTGANHH